MSPAPILNITLIQTTLEWENKAVNLNRFEKLIFDSPQTDVIILPEMFATGFSMNAAHLAESFPGPTALWMQRMAKLKQAAICGTVITEVNDRYYNRLIWAQPTGELMFYDKRHLFSFANEHDHYSPGTERLIVEYKGWRICPLICYDLRFPVWSRNSSLDGRILDFEYDLLIYTANWPEARRKPWITLLEARAHENQAYVVGVNRVGPDGNGINHTGDSAAFSPKGELLTDITPSTEKSETVALSWSDLSEFRQRFTAWKDKDEFRLI
jgi:omega-amidase